MDGEGRRWSSGDQFITVGISGRGHKTRVKGGLAVIIFMLPLDGFLD